MILLANGLETKKGCLTARKKWKNKDFSEKTIFVFLGNTVFPTIKNQLIDNLKTLGFCTENIIFWSNNINFSQESFDYVYIGEYSNARKLAKELNECGLIIPIRKLIKSKKTTFIGASAGAVLSCTKTIFSEVTALFGEAEDIATIDTLNLTDHVIIPHWRPKEVLIYGKTMNSKNKVFSVPDGKLLVLPDRWGNC